MLGASLLRRAAARRPLTFAKRAAQTWQGGADFRPLIMRYPKASFCGLVGGATALSTMGHTPSFYSHRFIVNCDPDDLAGFYGGEEFMELFCVIPFVGTLMMRGGEVSEGGRREEGVRHVRVAVMFHFLFTQSHYYICFIYFACASFSVRRRGDGPHHRLPRDDARVDGLLR